MSAARRLYQRVWNEDGTGSVFHAAVLLGGFAVTKLFVTLGWARRLPPIRRAYGSLYLYGKSLRDKKKTEYVLTHLQPGDVVVDVGAGAGYFAVCAAGKVGPSGRVICIEPEPISRGLLEINTRRVASETRGACEILGIAVGERRQNGVLHVCEWNLGESTLFPIDVGTRECGVQVESLDALRPAWEPVRMLKIDAQGWEAHILRGALNLLRSDRPIVLIEYWPFGLANSGGNPSELVSLLLSMNYRVYRLDRDGYPQVVDPGGLADLTVGARSQCDLLALPA